MRRCSLSLLTLLLVAASLPVLAAEPATAPQKETTAVTSATYPLFGGCGGVYLYAEPGPLVVDILKRDRNARDTITELRAILVGPDRQVLQEVSIPDDRKPTGSGLGPVEQVTLSTTVEHPGVYAVNITVSQDRYGDNLLWGFRTNCRRFLIETARGHRDRRHEEPIVLGSPEQPGDVCFLPRKGEMNLDASSLWASAGPLQLFDGAGKLVKELPVDETGKTEASFPADPSRGDKPWRLHFPAAKGVLSLDGLTRWETKDAAPDLCYWSPDLNSWFPFLRNRWLLSPYSTTVYGDPDEPQEVTFQVRNSAEEERSVKLALEFDKAPWPVQLSAQTVRVTGRSAVPVSLQFSFPTDGKPHQLRLRATTEDDGFSTYSTVLLKPGDAPATQALKMPILLKPYQHENEQFGYRPDYPLQNQMYFGPANHAVTEVSGGISVPVDGRWTTIDLSRAVTARVPDFKGDTFSLSTTKIGFDREGGMYLLATCSGTPVLLHSVDRGKTFTAYVIPGRRGAMDLEQCSGNNLPDGPMPFVRFIATASDPKLIWRRINDLELFVPRRVGDRLDLGQPILISRECIGFSGHSGMPSSVVSRGSKVHVIWGEATDPEAKVPGVPTFVVTYDRETGKLTTPALVGYGPPANDVHNTPSITMDAEGYLHILVGTHGRPFQYARSLKPNDSSAGWTEPQAPGADLSQTYVGLVCGPDNTLHTTFRLWRSGEPFPASSYATLAYQRKHPDQPWEEPRILIVAPFSEYSVFYHRLTIDQRGRLFLSYDYWSTYWLYRNDHFGSRRALLMSPDGGGTWKLVQTSDLQ